MTYSDGYSRPSLSFTLSGEAGVLANVTVRYRVGDGEWVEESFLGSAVGSTCTLRLPEYYAKGTEISFAFSGVSSSADVTASETRFAVDAELPPWYGHGGGEKVLHVWSKAPGNGSGTSWQDSVATWAAAVELYNSAAEGAFDEIWIVDIASPVKATPTLTTKGALAIRGGFDSQCDTADGRQAGAVATLDGDYKFNVLSVKGEHALTVERLCLTGSPSQAFVKTGSGDLALSDCVIEDNATGYGNAVYGAGLSVSGSAGVTKVSVSRCSFIGNGSSGSYNMGWGQGAYFKSCAAVTVEDSVFDKNGRKTKADGKDTSYGSALYADGAPLTARRCAFRSNYGTSRDNNYNGGAVRLVGASGPSRFENCIFAGNVDVIGWDASQLGSYGGALVVDCSSKEQTVDLVNCTIAYNYTDALTAPGGLEVKVGTVSAVNCIFYGNLVGSYTKAGVGADVYVKDDGAFSARYCLFTSLGDSPSVSATDAGTLELDASCFAADPLFVTVLDDDLAAKLKGTYEAAYHDELAAIDVHLRGGKGYLDERTGETVRYRGALSPAVDAGTGDYSNEAKPNGNRVNLGAYGNTPWATCTPSGFMMILR